MTALDDFTRLSGKLYLDGTWIASKSRTMRDVIEPATEDRLGAITDAEVDQVIEIADRVRRIWCGHDSRRRAVLLHEIAAQIRRDKALYGECLTL